MSENDYCYKCECWNVGHIVIGNPYCTQCDKQVGKLKGYYMGMNEEGRHMILAFNPPYKCPHCTHQADYWSAACKGTGELVIVRMRFPEVPGEL